MMFSRFTATLATYLLDEIDEYLIVSKLNIKKESSFIEFEPIKKLLNEGWFTKAPNR